MGAPPASTPFPARQCTSHLDRPFTHLSSKKDLASAHGQPNRIVTCSCHWWQERLHILPSTAFKGQDRVSSWTSVSRKCETRAHGQKACSDRVTVALVY
ncbi:unnamed protein product [Clonostachys byssicola]|uniref:Uncharacterized protein n=1 Tax=Clonostachys byssicola TaxID=160290 RepID=A0A9N9UPW2_9HYPO|nr:unnamed protein product [Clonostachys byssicola]